MRILIADDHTLLRDSLRRLLEARGMTVVGEAGSGAQAVELACRLAPDLVLMDLAMPEGGGLEATCDIRAAMPAVKVVVLTASTEDDDLFEAIKRGADGYLVKDVAAERFLELLEGVMRGEPALTPELAAKVLREMARPRAKDPDALTAREIEVLEAMVAGVTSNRQLAPHLGVSENTVKFHVRNILDKLHLHSRAQVIGFALREGLVKPED